MISDKERQELRRQAVDQATAEINGLGFKVPEGKGCIHVEESRRFVKQVLKGGEWQQKVLEHGFYPAFKTQPGRYRERNNASAIKDMEVVRTKVAEWLGQGAIMRLQEPAWCTSPLSVAAKWDAQTGQMKRRVVLDLSRHVNLCTEQYTVRMDDLTATEGTRQQGDYNTVFDLENQFFHVKLAPEAYKFFGFAIPDSDGREQYYCFKVMVYGFAPAVAVVTRLVRPAQAFLHERGVKSCMFVDDNNVAGETKDETERAMQLALLVYRLAGWNIQWKKKTPKAEQQIRYLGVQIDTKRMEYKLPEDKEREVLVSVNREWQRGNRGQRTTAKEAAEMLGKLAACRTTHGPVLHIMSREAQHQLGEATKDGNWDMTMAWDEKSIKELSWIKENMAKYNGRHLREEEGPQMKYEARETERLRRTVSSMGKQENEAVRQLNGQQGSYIYTSAKEVHQTEDIQDEGRAWIEEGLQDLKAIAQVLQNDKKQIEQVKGGRVIWETSSVNGYKFLKNGARQNTVQYWAREVRYWEMRRGVTIIPSWTGRSGTSSTTWRGKGASTDEWAVKEEWMEPILQRFQVRPTVDAFATADNARCEKFFSKGPQPGTNGVNFFAQQLRAGEVYHCCPPVKLAAHCIKKLLASKDVRAVLILPHWTSAVHWPLLRAGQVYIKEVRDWYTWTQECKDTAEGQSIFGRKSGVKMWAGLIHTGKIGYKEKG